jgi:hypothetical protein
MKKYKFKYLSREVGLINDIFYKHGVTLSIEELESYYKAIEEIAPIIHESYERYLKFLESKKGA